MDNNALCLLRSALWQRPCDTKIEADDWEEIIRFAEEQALDGLMTDSLLWLGEDSMPPMAKKLLMIARQLKVEQANKHLNNVMLRFTKELSKREIPYVLMKGQGVASLYPNPLHRVSGDIDMYVPMEYYHTVNKGMIAYGGVRDHETRHHVDYTTNGVIWELHHCVYYFQKDERNTVFMRLMDEAMAEEPVYAIVGDDEVRVLPPTMNVLLLLAHIQHHFFCSGIGLRQLCDYALMLDKEFKNIDKDRLVGALEELSMLTAYRTIGALCVKYLGLSPEKLMLAPNTKESRLADRIMLDCLKGGNFGRSDHSGRSNVWAWFSYYVRFISRLVKFHALCQSEALWWPLAKVYRFFTGTVDIKEEKSVLNTER